MKQHGFSLIEMVIGLSLLSLILLGWETVQVIALRSAETSYQYTVAIYQLNAMAERLIAAKGKNLTKQIASWKKQNAKILPHGQSKNENLAPYYRLSVLWGKPISDSNCNRIKLGSGCIRLMLHR